MSVLGLKRRTYGTLGVSTIAIFFTILILIIFAFLLLLYRTEALLTIKEKAVRSEVIIVLLGGPRPERVKQAKLLLHHSVAPLIIFGSGFNKLKLSWTSPPSYQWSQGGDRYLRQLLAMGVEKSQIMVIPTPDAYDTESEMQQLLFFIRSKDWKKVTIVTSASHSRRAKIIWNRLAPDISATVIAAPDPILERWWTSRQGIATIAHEYMGYIKEIGRRAKIFPSFDFSSNRD